MAAKCWLWPNRIINKTFSGKLREEHNEAVNEHDIMKRALEKAKGLLEEAASFIDEDDGDAAREPTYEAIKEIRDALKRLKP